MSSEQGFSVMEHDWFTSIQQSSDNGYLIGAETVNSVSAINGSSNNNTIQSCIIKTDINGTSDMKPIDSKITVKKVKNNTKKNFLFSFFKNLVI